MSDDQTTDQAPPSTGRVRMLRTVTDAEIAERLGQPRNGEGRYAKGQLVHFAPDVAAKLIAGADPLAEEDIDPEYGAVPAPTEPAEPAEQAVTFDNED